MSGSWKRLIILLSCACVTRTTLNKNFNPHTPIQQTWEVLNEEGNPVWSTTATHPPWVWWPDLTPDIYKLAAGSLSWDIPDHNDLLKPPPENQCVPSGIGSTYGCWDNFIVQISGLHPSMCVQPRDRSGASVINVEGHQTFTVLPGGARQQETFTGPRLLPRI